MELYYGKKAKRAKKAGGKMILKKLQKIAKRKGLRIYVKKAGRRSRYLTAKELKAKIKRSSKKTRGAMSLKQLQSLATTNEVSIFNRNTGKRLTIQALKARLTRMKVPYRIAQGVPVSDSASGIQVYSVDGTPIYQTFGRRYAFGSTVCRADQRINRRYKGKRGQKQCVKLQPKLALRALQALARKNSVSLYNFTTGKKLAIGPLKSRLTRMKVFHFGM